MAEYASRVLSKRRDSFADLHCLIWKCTVGYPILLMVRALLVVCYLADDLICKVCSVERKLFGLEIMDGASIWSWTDDKWDGVEIVWNCLFFVMI